MAYQYANLDTLLKAFLDGKISHEEYLRQAARLMADET